MEAPGHRRGHSGRVRDDRARPARAQRQPPDRHPPAGAGDLSWNNLTLHSATDVDFIKITGAANGTVNITATSNGSQGDVDMQLFDASGTQQVASSTQTGTNSETISRSINNGQVYFLKVLGKNGSTSPDYDLVIDGPGGSTGQPPPLVADQLEPNDSYQTGTRPGSAGDLSSEDLSLHTSGDLDIIKVTGAANGTVNITATFNAAWGDLDMQLLAADGQEVVASSTQTGTGSETISRSINNGQVYFLKVLGKNGSTHPEYDLVIDGPNPAATAAVR